MKLLLLAVIQTYWRFWPKQRRRSCLFRESCSEHVYNATDQLGLLGGLFALLQRMRQCREGYSIWTLDGKLVVRLADGSVVSEEEISPAVTGACQNAARNLELALNREGAPNHGLNRTHRYAAPPVRPAALAGQEGSKRFHRDR